MLADRGQAASRHNLGFVHERRGRLEEALACQRRSLAIFEELGDRYSQVEGLRQLGVTLRLLARREEARTRWRHAVALSEQLPTPGRQQPAAEED